MLRTFQTTIVALTLIGLVSPTWAQKNNTPNSEKSVLQLDLSTKRPMARPNDWPNGCYTRTDGTSVTFVKGKMVASSDQPCAADERV